MAIISTPKDLRLAFEKLVRGPHDVDDTYDLLSDARDLLETELSLKVLETLDTSKYATPGDTYLTMKSLPTDWAKTNRMVVDIIPYYPIPFNQRIGYRFSARHYYIDPQNKQFALTGAVASSKVINHFYQKRCPRFSTDNENTPMDTGGLILWPQTYWRVLIFEAAALFQGLIDGDDVSRAIAPAQWNQHTRLREALGAWDMDIKLGAMGDSLGYADEDDRPFDVGML